MGKNVTTSLGNKTKFRQLIDNFGLPRVIITGFLLLLFISAPIVGADLATQITNTINRFSWNAVLVLAMVPMIHSGCGLNFGLPLGIVSGLLGATLSIEFGFTGPMSFVMAILISTPFALLFGGGYGWLLNKIKGGEMMIATYVGFSAVSFMCMMWLLLPYRHPTMVWGFAGTGLRTVISLEGFYDQLLANFLAIDLNGIGINLRPNPAWPEEVRRVAGAISDFGPVPRRAALIASVLTHFEQAYSLVEQGREGELVALYRERLCCIGRKITVVSPLEKYEAECVGLDGEGHLLIRTADGAETTLSTGEISIRL
mgnify:CR=1 FL=1